MGGDWRRCASTHLERCGKRRPDVAASSASVSARAATTLSARFSKICAIFRISGVIDLAKNWARGLQFRSYFSWSARVVESGDFSGFFRIFQDFIRRAVRTLTILNNVWPPELGILNNIHSGGALRSHE